MKLNLLCLLSQALLFSLGRTQDTSNNGTTSNLPDVPLCAQICTFSAIYNSYCSTVPVDKLGECTCNNPQLAVETTACVVQNCTVKESLVALRFSQLSCGKTPRDDRSTHIKVTLFFALMSCILVIVRLAYKLFAFGLQELGLDDLFITLTILTGVIPGTIIYMVKTLPNGMGVDIWAVPFDNIYEYLKFHFIGSIIYFLQVGLLKMSLLFFYLRIFPARPIRRVLLGTVAVNAVSTVLFVLMNALQCAPHVETFWTSWDGEPEHQRQCALSFSDVSLANAAFSIALDVWMLAIPMFELRKLHLHWTKKLGVGIMFATGTFFTVLSCIRLEILSRIERTVANVTYDQLEISIWSNVEITVGIICACMPTMRLFLVRMFPRLASSTVRSYASRSGFSGSASKPISSAYSRASRPQSHLLNSKTAIPDNEDGTFPPFPLRTLSSPGGATVGQVRSMSPSTSIPPGAIRMEKDYSVVSTPHVGGNVATDSDDDHTRLVIMGNSSRSTSRENTGGKRK